MKVGVLMTADKDDHTMSYVTGGSCTTFRTVASTSNVEYPCGEASRRWNPSYNPKHSDKLDGEEGRRGCYYASVEAGEFEERLHGHWYKVKLST